MQYNHNTLAHRRQMGDQMNYQTSVRKSVKTLTHWPAYRMAIANV